MKKLFASIVAALCFATAAYGQNSGTVTAGAYAIGKGPGVAGFTSLLCGAGQLAVGQAGAPICRTVSGDWTLNAAGVSTLSTVNPNVGSFGSTTQCPSFTVNAKGLITAASQGACAPPFSAITGRWALNQAPQGIANSIWINPTAAPADMQNLAVPACANDGLHGLVYVNGTGLQCATLAAATFNLATAQGRISLAANVPVHSTSVGASGTLHYTCYVGNQVPYFTGGADTTDTIAGCDVANTMVSAASAGQVVSGQVYDVWWVQSGANRICLAMSSAVGGGGGWASDAGGSNTTRGTGYSQIDRITRPYPTNKNSITNCFNGATNYGPVAANRGTYLGTVTASANGQVSWTFGTAASGGGAAIFGVWNFYNRVNVNTMVEDTFSSRTTAAGTIEPIDVAGTGSGLNNRITYVMGLPEDTVFGGAVGNMAAASGGACGVAVGHDSTSAISGLTGATQSTVLAPVTAYAEFNNDSGLHFIQGLQWALTQTGTLIGSGNTANAHTGTTFKGRM